MEIKNIGQLLQHLTTKAGIDQNDKNLINLLSNAELTKVPIHSDLVKSLDESLLSVEAASDNHPTIGSKYKAQALNAFDKSMSSSFDIFGLDDESKSELAGITSSYKRYEALMTKIKELFDKKQQPTKPEKDALQKQIDELLAQAKADKQKFESELDEEKKGRKSDKISFDKRTLLNGKKTIYDTLDETVKIASIDAILNKALQDKDAEFTYDEKGNFIILKKDGSNLVGANHNKYTPQTFFDEILAQNKILVVSQQQQQQNNQQQQQVIPGGAATTITGTNQSVVDFNQQQLAAMANEG